MDTALRNGDFGTDASGRTVDLTGKEALLQQVLIRLKLKRGSLPYAPNLGSRLSTLTPESRTLETVLRYIAEALDDSEEITVVSAEVAESGLIVMVDTPYGAGSVTI